MKPKPPEKPILVSWQEVFLPLLYVHRLDQGLLEERLVDRSSSAF